MEKLTPNEKINIEEILKDLESYRPKRRGWTWRKSSSGEKQGPFVFHDLSQPLKQSVPLPSAKLKPVSVLPVSSRSKGMAPLRALFVLYVLFLLTPVI